MKTVTIPDWATMFIVTHTNYLVCMGPVDGSIQCGAAILVATSKANQ